MFFFFSSRRRHTRLTCDWSSDVCSSDLKPESLIRFVTDRPGHDRRYAMDIGRIRSTIGWVPRRDFAAGLAATVEWYLSHRTWWERVLSEAYRTAAAMYLAER